MSTPVSGPGTPGVSHHASRHFLNQSFQTLPVSTRVVDNAALPRQMPAAPVSRSRAVDILPGVEEVNRLWSLFEQALTTVHPEVSLDTASEDARDRRVQTAELSSSEIGKIAEQAQRDGLRRLNTLSYWERGQALIVALREGYTDVIHALLNKQSDLYAADDRGMTALRVAAETGQLKVLAYLLKAGCSIEAEPRAADPHDAIHCAEQAGQHYAAVMMALHTNIRFSMIEADHPYRHCKGETPVAVVRRRRSTY